MDLSRLPESGTNGSTLSYSRLDTINVSMTVVSIFKQNDD